MTDLLAGVCGGAGAGRPGGYEGGAAGHGPSARPALLHQGQTAASTTEPNTTPRCKPVAAQQVVVHWLAVWLCCFALTQDLSIDSLAPTGKKLSSVKGALEFKNIHFRYPARSDSQQSWSSLGPSARLPASQPV